MPLVKGGRNGDNGEKYKRRRNIPLLAIIGTLVCVIGLIATLMANTHSTGKLAGAVEKTLEVHDVAICENMGDIDELKIVAHAVAVNTESIEVINTACKTMKVEFVPRPEAELQFTELRKAQNVTQETVENIYDFLLKQ